MSQGRGVSCSPIGSDGVVRCFVHHLPAHCKTSSTSKNPGRKFYCCSLPQDDPERCKFWYWQDELLPGLSQAEAAMSRSPNQTSSHLDSSPTRTKRSGDSDNMVGLTPSQKRTRMIEEALSQGNSTPPGPVNRSLHDSPVTEPPSTPFKSCRSSQNNYASNSRSRFEGRTNRLRSSSPEDEDWDIPTPPPSNPPFPRDREGYDQGHLRFASNPLSPSPLSRGKGRALIACHDSDDIHTASPFSTSAESYDQPQVSRKLDFSQSTQTSPTTSDESTSEVLREMAQHAHLFNPRWQTVLKELPDKWDALKKSERKRLIAEKRAEARSKRIAILTKEVEVLKEELQELEKALH